MPFLSNAKRDSSDDDKDVTIPWYTEPSQKGYYFHTKLSNNNNTGLEINNDYFRKTEGRLTLWITHRERVPPRPNTWNNHKKLFRLQHTPTRLVNSKSAVS